MNGSEHFVFVEITVSRRDTMGKGLNWFPRPTWPDFRLCSVMFLSGESGNGKKQCHILLRCFCMIPPGNTPFATRRPLFVCFGYKKSTSYTNAEGEQQCYLYYRLLFFYNNNYIIYMMKIKKNKNNNKSKYKIKL